MGQLDYRSTDLSKLIGLAYSAPSEGAVMVRTAHVVDVHGCILDYRSIILSTARTRTCGKGHSARRGRTLHARRGRTFHARRGRTFHARRGRTFHARRGRTFHARLWRAVDVHGCILDYRSIILSTARTRTCGKGHSARRGRTLHARRGRTLHARRGRTLHARRGRTFHARRGRTFHARLWRAVDVHGCILDYRSIILSTARTRTCGKGHSARRGRTLHARRGCTFHARRGRTFHARLWRALGPLVLKI
ncbi:hypothetical protein BDP27DRAFT_1422236 [Rhodocollybia butyracea]|uniref:Uncharacterized protein n=1 Tax=Rhodocollybia butyracea TaxID=206335 RepID=A0A9P5U7S0_9AGAR|nr:hypothetical protein BDP27DRAFT_1422236 [Rhodocollybia butyracea]